jgi:hypothetical protein
MFLSPYYYYSPIIYRYHPEEFNTNPVNEKQNENHHRLFLRSTSVYPRANRNTWFRVSTYQYFRPVVSENTNNGDNPMRWGRSS